MTGHVRGEPLKAMSADQAGEPHRWEVLAYA